MQKRRKEMAHRMTTEDDVKKALGIQDFRSITKAKMVEFISLIPNMDKDLALSIINQFPAYSEFASTTIAALKEMCDSALTQNGHSQKDTIAAYRKILDELGEILKKENISAEERNEITDKMILIADKIAMKDSENKNFIKSLVKYTAAGVVTALVIGAAILGINIKDIDFPATKK